MAVVGAQTEYRTEVVCVCVFVGMCMLTHTSQFGSWMINIATLCMHAAQRKLD